MKNLKSWLFFLFLIPVVTRAQQEGEKEILNILNSQAAAWNEGNVEKFMTGYWQNDSLMYIGRNGITYGYQNTLRRYKENYSDTAQMGKLSFDILHVKNISAEAIFVVGKWFLKRSVGDAGGFFSLLFRKINGEWVIVADHSS